ncbi:MAG: hypothetical protein SOI44_08275 [Lactimicrobium sp.]|jgi:hypothetical protein|uniref:hypothetical protein n=1 Tax=Lactimicrobium sp. TaxID=2563780 RepID=UPI002F359B4C
MKRTDILIRNGSHSLFKAVCMVLMTLLACVLLSECASVYSCITNLTSMSWLLCMGVLTVFLHIVLQKYRQDETKQN